jgi:hypothetical protein
MSYNKAVSKFDLHRNLLNAIQASIGKLRMDFIIQGDVTSD